MCDTSYLFLTGPSSKIWQPKQNEFNLHFTWLDNYSIVISVANNFITKRNKGMSWTPRCSSELLSEWGLSSRALHGAITKLASDLDCYKGMHPRSKHGKSEGVLWYLCALQVLHSPTSFSQAWDLLIITAYQLISWKAGSELALLQQTCHNHDFRGPAAEQPLLPWR